jgi:hypothetical protein
MARNMPELSALAQKRHIVANMEASDAVNIPQDALERIRQAERASASEFAANWKIYRPTMEPRPGNRRRPHLQRQLQPACC